MRHSGFHYQVSVNIKLTADDLRLVRECSEGHYDHKCRTFFNPGNKGNGLRNCFTSEDGHIDPFDETCPPDLECDDHIYVDVATLDRIIKILGLTTGLPPKRVNRAHRLRAEITEAISAIRAERERLAS